MKRMFCVFNRCVLAVTAILIIVASAHAHAVTIDWVTVGDPGNANDTIGAGYGAVAEAFQIMKFEWTNSQYVEFLNAVDPAGSNPNGIYKTSMTNDVRGGITFTSGNPAGSKYVVKANMGSKPVNFTSWYDAARVANWLQNGQGSGSTETGAYTLNGVTSGTVPAVNSGAVFYIPTENQWYKAAFYKGGGTNAGYWDYATQSDTAPTQVTASGTGNGSAGSTGNFANYGGTANWNGIATNVTTVGTNGGSGAYGTFDMNGNVNEWNDLTGVAGTLRGFRGGGSGTPVSHLASSSRYVLDPATSDYNTGFRIATVPEPSTFAMALAGLACGGYLVRRRRKRA
jgi:sulfatase modifying factor 1